ncbi:carbohydrate-binding protein [Streptomyces sp. NPDC050625]|uniref:carbohydrate-binding protein n=1 Tax=Streptomyces sp. NPDC050625 TaxID=3154629 RepID=UPI0034444C8A
MTPGDNGASTPEDEDPFGYLYADGQARGAQPPSGGYGYPNSVSRVRPVGERTYGGQQGQTIPQQGTYGQPNAHYQAPETLPGGAPTTQQPLPGGGRGRGSGPNTKGLLIGAVAVVAAVVIGISIAVINGNDDKKDNAANPSPTQSQSASPKPSSTSSVSDSGELPKIDAKALRLEGGATTASDVKGAQADGGVYVTNFNNVGASVTWTVNGIPDAGKYTVFLGYSVPGKDGTGTLTINGTPSNQPVKFKNWAKAPEGNYERGWTKTYNWVQLTKGTNTIKISCEQGNQCDAYLDQLSLAKGWVTSED